MRSWVAKTIALTTFPGAALAQVSNAPQEAGAQIEEIVVTAERRSGSLQTTPVSVTALTASALEDRQVTNVLDIAGQVPNLAIDPVTGIGNAARIFLRGVGEDQAQFTADPAIGVYVDGVYLARTFGALFDFLDVDRVEVLRGPQGTLYGRNTPGGAINVITQQPGDNFKGLAELSYGRFDQVEVRGTVSGPITTGVLAASASVLHRRRDGITQAPNIGRRVNNKDITSVRSQLVFTPGNNLSLRLAGDKTWDDSDAFVPTSNFTGPPADLFVTQAAQDPAAEFRTGGVSLKADWELGDFTLGSITAYRDLSQSATLDNDGELRLLSGQSIVANQDQVSQEVTVSYASDRIKGIAGLFYFDEFNDYDTVTFIGSRLNPAVRIARPDFATQDTKSYAVFGQATIGVLSDVNLTLGARYTWDEKSFVNSQPSVPATFRAERKWEEFTPKVGLDWRLSEEVFLFALYARGYKAGGFNRSNVRIVAETPYDPEVVESYEAGIKTDLFERRLRANLTLFNNDYTDLQLSSFDPNTGTTRRFNAASTRTRGIELELSARPAPTLDIYGSVGYLDANYKRFFDRVGGVLTDVSSRALKGAPEWQGSAGIGWEPEVLAAGTVRLGADISYRDQVFNNVANTPEIATGARTLLNASIRYTTADERWAFTAAGRNLLDRKYAANGIFIGGLLSALYPADPLTWSLSARLKF